MVLMFLLIARVVSMIWIPLNDSTEARYAEIARLMLDSGNWVTPMHHPGAYFWAKPPLSTWLSAGSMTIFGVSAWAARLPALLISIGILVYLWRYIKKYRDSQYAITVVLILAGCLYFFLDAGTVMTDPALLLSTTMSILFFWRGMSEQKRIFGYGFFAGLGIGLLAKGPIAVVLTILPLFFWTLYFRQWRLVWRALPWLSGSILTLIIALPWYCLAEYRTPGFLNYFIIGEHLQRFLTPGWTGDMYGFAHHAPIGMIWMYALLGFMPWTVIGGVGILYFKAEAVPLKNTKISQDQRLWVGFLWMTALMPLVFFTMARNIIYPYVFPALPFMALLLTEYLYRWQLLKKIQNWLILNATVVGTIFIIATGLFVLKPDWISKSQDRVIQSVSVPVIYWKNSLDYSAEFYSNGKARATDDASILMTWLNQGQLPHYVVVASNVSKVLPAQVLNQLVPIKQVDYHYANFTIYRWIKERHFYV